MRGEAAANGSPGVLPALWLGTVLPGVMLLGVNTGFTVLKETPLFWHNAGGFPVALRELVLAVYYPLLGLNALLCLVVAALIAFEYRRSGRGAWWAVAVGVLMWGMLVFNVGWLMTNNVENLMIGRELHYHAPSAD